MTELTVPARIAISEPRSDLASATIPVQLWGRTFDVVMHGGKWCAIDEGGHEVLCLTPQDWEDNVEAGSVELVFEAD